MENNLKHEIFSEDRWKSLHKKAFKDTYETIKNFSEHSQKNYSRINKNKSNDPKDSYIHQVLCSPPGHGKTSALQYHIGKEIIQTEAKKNPYLLVFNNKDTMNNLYVEVNLLANEHNVKNAILAIEENNIGQYLPILENYQIVCITKQRLRDMAIGFGEAESFFLYQQEQFYWGKKPPKVEKAIVQRTIIIDEMPEFFNSVIFDIGKENNMLDWYDSFADNTDNNKLSDFEKNKGRLYISNLFNLELANIGHTTLRLNRSIASTDKEVELTRILENLNKDVSNYEYINRYLRFMRLLNEESVGAINNISKKNILCSDFIDYRGFGNILILDGTAKETHTIYEHAGFEIKQVQNYHRYKERLFFVWCKINTSSYKRSDRNNDIKEKIAESITEKREKGLDILPIPSKSDIEPYIKLGVITNKQKEDLFMDRQNVGDSLAINIHNLTGKNDLSEYNNIALLNLPIMKPDEYRLQAIAIYGTYIDLRLVKELEKKEEQKLHKGKWFVDDRVQNLFEEQQRAELSQIIHRSAIRNINSNEKVTIHLYHNKEKVNHMLMEMFNITDNNFEIEDIQKNNNFKVKCKVWAEKISVPLKNNPDAELTSFKVGGRKFQKWVNDNWNNNEKMIRDVFKEYEISILVRGKSNYKYFVYYESEFARLFADGYVEDLFS